MYKTLIGKFFLDKSPFSKADMTSFWRKLLVKENLAVYTGLNFFMHTVVAQQQITKIKQMKEQSEKQKRTKNKTTEIMNERD